MQQSLSSLSSGCYTAQQAAPVHSLPCTLFACAPCGKSSAPITLPALAPLLHPSGELGKMSSPSHLSSCLMPMAESSGTRSADILCSYMPSAASVLIFCQVAENIDGGDRNGT
mmetsp:Transcript_25304/g.70762  ORF Transcript_25304/g.70762 Transcript_25304/m.70762 type:complete len:113 (-) Transcript_25304:193-531(-)